MNKNHLKYLFSTAIAGSLMMPQIAQAEYFRMPLSMFTIIGGVGVKDPNGDDNKNPDGGISSPGNGQQDGSPGSVVDDGIGGGSGGSGKPGDNSNNPEPETISRFTLSPADPFQLQLGTSSSIDFSQYISYQGGGLGNNPNFRWQATAGNLPHGMSFTGSVLSGAPTQASNYSAEITAFYLGSVSETGVQTYTFNVSRPALNVMTLGAGGGHTCAVTYESGLWCWGNSSPIGASEKKLSPWNTGKTRVTHVSTGKGSGNCVVTNGSSVTCTGATSYNGTKTIANVQKVVTGWLFACALTTAGAVKCWGSNANGELGNGSTTSNNNNPTTPIYSDAIDVSAGMHHACAVLKNGDIRCWGKNDYYQTGGTNYKGKNLSSVVTHNIPGAKHIVSGGNHNCVLTEESRVSCWGLGSKLGSSTDTRLDPAPVSFSKAPTQLSASENRTCAILIDGTVNCWGTSGSYTPSYVAGGAKSIFSGRDHHCIITDANIRCWGSNSSGQIGIGATYDEVSGPTNVNIDF